LQVALINRVATTGVVQWLQRLTAVFEVEMPAGAVQQCINAILRTSASFIGQWCQWATLEIHSG